MEELRNQSGCKVPTEYAAIKNIMKKPETRVARYDKPNLDERQRAADMYNESIKAGMTEDEALEMVRISLGIEGEWLKCVPEWARAVKERAEEEAKKVGHRRKYDPKTKRRVRATCKKYLEQGMSLKDAGEATNKELGLNLVTATYRNWMPELSSRVIYSAKKRREAADLYAKYRETMNRASARERVCEDLGIDAAVSTMDFWMNGYGIGVKHEEPTPKAEARTCGCCGKEISAEYKYCPFCGYLLETDKDRALRVLDEVVYSLTHGGDGDNAARLETVKDYILSTLSA